MAKKRFNDPAGLLAVPDENAPPVTAKSRQCAGLLYEAVAAEREGDEDGARRAHRKIIDILGKPANYREAHIRAEALHMLAALEIRLGRFGTAHDLAVEAIGINSMPAHYHTTAAIALSRMGLHEKAHEFGRRATLLAPGFAHAHYNLGLIERSRENMEAARESFFKVLSLAPQDTETIINIGTTYHFERNLDKAEHFYRKALAIDPENHKAWYNVGVTYQDRGDYKKAISYYEKSLLIDPNYVMARWNRSLALLALGNYEEGWKEYEWRWKFRDIMQDVSYPGRRFARPIWDGSSGKTVHIHVEQGFGDSIQFSRYIPLAAQRDCRIVVECHDQLFDLFDRSFSSDTVSVTRLARDWPGGIGIQDFDMHAPIMSLPYIMGTTVGTIPANIPYLKTAPDKVEYWRRKLEQVAYGDKSSLPKVGLVWGSGVRVNADPAIKRIGERKSMSLRTFLPVVQNKGILPVSLQLGPWRQEIHDFDVDIVDYGDELKSFDDTAALIENLDAVICVDTAVGHLAGALGKKTYVLELFDGCWRWFTDRSDSPWYPSHTIIRQVHLDDWAATIPKVVEIISNDLVK